MRRFALLISVQMLWSASAVWAQVVLTESAWGATSAAARQEAQAALSYSIAVQVESVTESNQQLANDQFTQSARQQVVLRSQLPILGAETQVQPQDGQFLATITLRSEAALPLYRSRLTELSRNIQQNWNTAQNLPPEAAYERLQALLTDIEQWQKHRLVAQRLGERSLSELEVSTPTVRQRLQALEANPTTLAFAAQVLAAPWKSRGKIYVYPPTTSSSPEPTEFATLFRTQVASHLQEVTLPAQSEFLLRGEYMITAQGLELIYRLQNWKGETLESRSLRLAPAVYGHLQVQPPQTVTSVANSRVENSDATQPTAAASLRSEPLAPQAAGDTWRDPLTGMDFRRVPAGSFEMGDSFGDGEADEQWVREVTLDEFWISETEVTQQAWERIMGKPAKRGAAAKLPVEVTAREVESFLQRLNQAQQQAHVFRLPTEAEWEFTCREGGKQVKYGTGKNQLPWSEAAVAQTQVQRVGSFAANALGLFDMSGNVAEWVQDRYQASYQGLGSQNPVVTQGRSGIVRGGGIAMLLPNAEPRQARCTARQQVRSSRDRFGLRLVRELR